MNQVFTGGSKKRKQGDRVFSFKNFCTPGNPAHFDGTFQENIRDLLDLGDRDAGGLNHRSSFQLELHSHPPLTLTLYVIEEIVDSSSQLRQCHHCKYVGWGHHMICRKRYHFVMPAWRAGARMAHGGGDSDGGGGCGEEREVGSGNYYSCNVISKASGSDKLQSQQQLMHAVVHSNGFGHLLSVNGIAGGSEVVSGHQILDLWNRLCSALKLRKVSLTDTARRGAMSLRLVHGIGYGETWFGNWGYRYGRGSYGVTHPMYRDSIEALQSLPLCLLAPHFGSLRHEIPAIIAKYQTISCNSLLTLGQLFHFMLELKRHLPPETMMAMNFHGIASQPACRWSAKRVEMAAQVIVDTLKKAGNQWIPRQDVRDTARIYIGDTGLLDFVLKSIGNHVVGNHMVRRLVNPVTKVLEYCLEDISHSISSSVGNAEDHYQRLPPTSGMFLRSRPQHLTRMQLMRDMFYLYKYILKEQNPTMMTGIFNTIPLAVRVILDTKHLVRDYDGDQMAFRKNTTTNNRIQIMCTVQFKTEEWPIHSYDPILVPANSTVGDLKKIAETHFRETYLGMKSFVVESLMEGGDSDTELVTSIVEATGGAVAVLGSNRIINGDEVIYEGYSVGVVDCPCGAKEDDGERMISCDVCEVWQHSRCLDIPNGEEIPRVFLCRCCERNIVDLPPSLLF